MDAESICSGNPHVTSPPGVFPKHPPSEGMLRPSFISQRQTEEPAKYQGYIRYIRKRFLHIHKLLRQLRILRNWILLGRKTIEEPIHRSIAEKSGRPERDSDLRCQSGPSAKNSVIFSGGDSSKNYGADQQRLQISDLHFDKFPTPANLRLLEDKIQDPIRGISMPDFEVLDARIASALNKIIHNSPFQKGKSVWRNKRPRKRNRFLRGRQIAYLIYEQFRVTGTDDSVENYTDLFTIALRNDDIQEFDSKWDGILMSMTKNPAWWHLGRIVQIKNTRVWENSRPYWNCMTWRLIKRS